MTAATHDPEHALLLHWERSLAGLLRARDPEAAISKITTDLQPPLAGAIATIDRDGLKIASLLVTQLRFERLMHGSLRASAWFEAQPQQFTRVFRRYHAEVPATASFPADEGVCFDTWATACAVWPATSE